MHTYDRIWLPHSAFVYSHAYSDLIIFLCFRISSKRERKILNAIHDSAIVERSFWQLQPGLLDMSNTYGSSVFFTFCPPAPDDRNTSIFRSEESM